MAQKAIVLEDKVLCGKCGHKIAELEGSVNLEGWKMRIKCKHRDAGKNCNTVNEIGQ